MSPDKQKMLAACTSAPGKIQTIILDDKLNVVNQVIVGVNLSDFTIPEVVTTDNKACIVLTGKDGTRIICFDSKGKKNEINCISEARKVCFQKPGHQ